MGNAKMTPARLGVMIGAGMAVAVLAACGSSGTSSSSAPATTGAAASGSGSSGSGAMVITTASGSGATFLTDGSGRAVYMWAKDSSGQSACSGACAGAWPPVTANGTVTASGSAQASDLGSITRSDGTKQVTYDGHALYYFSGDSGPGQANGQGSDGFGAKWWLVSPAGSDVTGTVSAFTPGSSGSGSSGSGSSGSPSPSAPAPTSKSSSAWA